MKEYYETFEDLHADIEAEYGSDWDLHGRFVGVAPDDEASELEAEFIRHCYDLYERTYDKRDVLKSDDQDFNGRPFEIVAPVEPGEDGYDQCALPIYRVRMTDNGDEFATYPEEIFEID